MGLHAREADVHACERGERGALGELGERGELGGHARITAVVQGSESDARARSKGYAVIQMHARAPCIVFVQK